MGLRDVYEEYRIIGGGQGLVVGADALGHDDYCALPFAPGHGVRPSIIRGEDRSRPGLNRLESDRAGDMDGRNVPHVVGVWRTRSQIGRFVRLQRLDSQILELNSV